MKDTIILEDKNGNVILRIEKGNIAIDTKIIEIADIEDDVIRLQII